MAFMVMLSVACGTAYANGYKVPRLADGAPDLQGTWTNATATPFERSPELGTRRAYTEAEAMAISRAAQSAVEEDNKPSDPNKKIEAAGSLPPVGNYNLFWTDRGMWALNINGEWRSSVIIDPANGRIPPMKPEAQKRFEVESKQRRERMNDGPEGRALGERCLLSFGSSGGPPMLPTMYNSYYQIVQSPGYVMILVEMVHDVRMIRIDGKPLPKNIQQWMGDSIGRWEGDTLVVETRNFRPEQSFRGTSENAVITERFKRVGPNQIVYTFTVDDPSVYAQPFTGELAFTPAGGDIYEYACHEGNYALPGILAGEREAEKAAAASTTAR